MNKQLLLGLLLCSYLLISCYCRNETVSSPTKPAQHPPKDQLPPSPGTKSSNQETTGSPNTTTQDPSKDHQPTPHLSGLEKRLKELGKHHKKNLEDHQKQVRERSQKQAELLQEHLKFKNGKVFFPLTRDHNVMNIKSSVDAIKKNIQEVGGTTPLDPTLKQDINEIFDRIDKEIKEIKEEKKSIARYLVSTEKSPLISDTSEDMSAAWATNLINNLKSYKKELCGILASRRQELNNPELEAAYKKGSLSGTSNPHAKSSSQSYLTNDVDGSGKIFSFIGTCKELFPELKQQLEESTPRRIIYPEWFDSILKEDTEHIKSKLNEIKQRTDSANEDSANKELEELRRQYSGEVQKLLELMKESRERELKFKDGKYFQPSLRKSNVEEVKHFLDFIKEELQAVDAKTPFNKEYKEDISSLFNDINREFKGIQEEMGGTEKCLSLPEKSPDINYEQEAENLELAKQLIKDLESYQEELCKLLASRRQELNNPELEAAYQEVEQRKRASN
jgi:hypothetical protein